MVLSFTGAPLILEPIRPKLAYVKAYQNQHQRAPIDREKRYFKNSTNPADMAYVKAYHNQHQRACADIAMVCSMERKTEPHLVVVVVFCLQCKSLHWRAKDMAV